MMNEEVIRRQMEQEIKYLVYLIEKCEKEGLTNEQWFLEIEDQLNQLSVKNHDIDNNNLNANKKQ